jgi:hypothetical protein
MQRKAVSPSPPTTTAAPSVEEDDFVVLEKYDVANRRVAHELVYQGETYSERQARLHVDICHWDTFEERQRLLQRNYCHLLNSDLCTPIKLREQASTKNQSNRCTLRQRSCRQSLNLYRNHALAPTECVPPCTKANLAVFCQSNLLWECYDL